MIRKELEVLVVAADEADATFATRVLEEQGDRVSVAPSVPDAVGRLGRGDVDVALVSLSLPHGDGLALVHHLRALYPMVDVIVLTTPQDLEESSHAMALGVLQTVIRPLTGDALLVAVDRARERRMLLDQRARLDAEARSGRKRTATYARCAAFIAETDRDIVASRILEACSQELALRAGALYLPPHLGARAFTRSASVGDGDALPRALEPEALDELDPTQAVTVADGRIQIAFLGPMDLAAAAVLVPEKKLTEAQEDALTIIASLGTASLEAARKVDAIARSGIKDPETSAYTFAYFGDVAGREIDRAARHGRRFALVTITFDGAERLERTAPDVQRRIRRLLTESVLAAVRDSDVVARVEDDELFLLLPETALLGVLGARRRVEARFAAQQELQELLTAEHGGPRRCTSGWRSTPSTAPTWAPSCARAGIAATRAAGVPGAASSSRGSPSSKPSTGSWAPRTMSWSGPTVGSRSTATSPPPTTRAPTTPCCPRRSSRASRAAWSPTPGAPASPGSSTPPATSAWARPSARPWTPTPAGARCAGGSSPASAATTSGGARWWSPGNSSRGACSSWPSPSSAATCSAPGGSTPPTSPSPPCSSTTPAIWTWPTAW